MPSPTSSEGRPNDRDSVFSHGFLRFCFCLSVFFVFFLMGFGGLGVMFWWCRGCFSYVFLVFGG